MGTGNCFYVSMPAGSPDSSTDPSGLPTSPSQPDTLPAWQTEPLPQLQGGSEDQRPPSRSPPRLALRDVGAIFRTIEQLTLKLSRLKVRALGSLRTSTGGGAASHGSPRAWPGPGLLPWPIQPPASTGPSPGPRGLMNRRHSLRLFQDMELAHRELLRSLGGESSGGTTPVGSFHTQAATWTDSFRTPPAREPLASDPRDSQELGFCHEEGE